MAQENITIKFTPSGDKQLVAAIKQLDVATKRLEGKTSQYERELKKLGLTQAQVNKVLKSGTKHTRIQTGAFATLRSNLLLYAFAVGLTTKAMKGLFDKMIIQEKAERKLQTALGKTNTALLHHASALQKVTEFGDEEIINAQALFAAYTDDEEAIKAATQATLDLASAKGMDLNTAADLVSKSVGSSTNALSRYGITIKGSVNSTQRLNHATREISNLYGGQATDQAETFGGSLKQLSNATGDLSEQIGEFLSPVVSIIAKDFKQSAEAATDFFREMNEFPAETIARKFEELGIKNKNLVTLKMIGMQERLSYTLQEQESDINSLVRSNADFLDIQGDVADALSYVQQEGSMWSIGLQNAATGLGDLNFNFADATISTDRYSQVLNNAKGWLEILSKQLREYEDIGSDEAKTTLKKFMAYSELVTKLEHYAATNEKVRAEIALLLEGGTALAETNPVKKFFDDIDLKKVNEDVGNLTAVVDAIGGVGDAYMKMEMQNINQKKEAKLAAAESIRSERARQKAIDKINKEAEKEEKKIKKRNQKFRIMDAIANTAVGITKALELAFPLNVIVSTLVAAQGAMQVATLKAQKFEKGGLVGGRRHSQGGTMIEAEKGEFVMSRSAVDAVGIETMNRINTGGGAGNVSVSFAGNVMSDDFIESEAIPKIKEAIRRGADIGVS